MEKSGDKKSPSNSQESQELPKSNPSHHTSDTSGLSLSSLLAQHEPVVSKAEAQTSQASQPPAGCYEAVAGHSQTEGADDYELIALACSSAGWQDDLGRNIIEDLRREKVLVSYSQLYR